MSGALNIGATYGSDAVPMEITEQVKEDIAKMKNAKEEMEKHQTSSEKQPDFQNEESASDLNARPLEEDLPYTNIIIEDDPSSEEDPG